VEAGCRLLECRGNKVDFTIFELQCSVGWSLEWRVNEGRGIGSPVVVGDGMVL
jgi:hypothetical protein